MVQVVIVCVGIKPNVLILIIKEYVGSVDWMTKCSFCGSTDIRICECGNTEICNECDEVIQKW